MWWPGTSPWNPCPNPREIHVEPVPAEAFAGIIPGKELGIHMVPPAALLGLDLGASKIVAVVAAQEEGGGLTITGASMTSPEGGIRNGEITDINLASAAITRAVREPGHVAARAAWPRGAAPRAARTPRA